MCFEIEQERWGETGLFCSRCGGCDRVKPSESRKPMPYWCDDCRQRFSVRMGTLMERSKIPLYKWAIAIYMVTTNLKSVSSMKLHRDLGHYPKIRLVHAAPHPSNLRGCCPYAGPGRSRSTKPLSVAKSKQADRANYPSRLETITSSGTPPI